MDELVRGLVGSMELGGGPAIDLTVLINGVLLTGTMVKAEEWVQACESQYPQLQDLIQYLGIPTSGGSVLHMKDVNIVEEGVPRPFGIGGYARFEISTIDGSAFGIHPSG